MGEKKSNFGLGILIGLLIAIILGLVGFIIYDKVITNDNSQVEKENEESKDTDKETNKFIDIDAHSDIVINSMNLLNNQEKSETLSACLFINNIYDDYASGIYNGKITIDDFDNDLIMNLIYNNLLSKCEYFTYDDGSCRRSESEFITSAKKVFGSKYKIPESGELCGRRIEYDSANKIYKVFEVLGGDEHIVTATNTFVSAKMNNDTLVVVEKVEFSYPKDDVDPSVGKYYSNDLMLEYTFKKDLTTGFYFYSIEKK